MLKLDDIRKRLPFSINIGLAACRVCDIGKEGYEFDYDVFLPSIGKNLQRDYVWTLFQKQQLVLSVLKDIRLPPMALIHKNHSIFLVIDGKQRINALVDYYNGKFYFEHENKKYYYCDLAQDAQRAIGLYYITADVAYEYDDCLIPDQCKIEWFKKINFAGTPQDYRHFAALQMD